ncbi:MAG: adenylate cyclase [Clostridiales bacterium]|jgi:Amt family ammonium transporter|nr:adenylate cyclase [Clostridiales bacterium]
MLLPVDTVWVLAGAVLVFFMQAGFAMMQTGLARAKDAGDIAMKNLAGFCLGSLAFWAVGFGLARGESVGGLVGAPDFLAMGEYGGAAAPAALVLFQTGLCGAAAAIASGAMAGRAKLAAHCACSLAICALVYPVSAHWIWGGGWLAALGFRDFGGSAAVHMVGGVAGLVGAKMLGPRTGKYGSDGAARAIPGHSLTLGALGALMLWFSWFGLNGGAMASVAGEGGAEAAAGIFLATNLAAAAAASVSMAVTWARYKKPDASLTLNGAIGGLAAISAGCGSVSPLGAALIGGAAGLVAVFGIEFIDKRLKIDDPAGAIGAHAACGAAGTLLAGVLALDGGLLHGGGLALLGAQALGVLAVAAWAGASAAAALKVARALVGLRAAEGEEAAGPGIDGRGIGAGYADFLLAPALPGVGEGASAMPPASIDDEIRASYRAGGEGARMTKVTIVTRQNRFDALKAELTRIGITGMTVSQVLGCGMQSGEPEYYRGVPFEMRLLPKIMVDIVISKIPPEVVIETAKKALCTGRYGDGKIFVSDIENVVKVRTGEEGYDALQDEVPDE